MICSLGQFTHICYYCQIQPHQRWPTAWSQTASYRSWKVAERSRYTSQWSRARLGPRRQLRTPPQYLRHHHHCWRTMGKCPYYFRDIGYLRMYSHEINSNCNCKIAVVVQLDGLYWYNTVCTPVDAWRAGNRQLRCNQRAESTATGLDISTWQLRWLLSNLLFWQGPTE